MRVFKKRLAEGYQIAQEAGRVQVKRPYLVPLFGIVLGFIIVLALLAGHNDQTLRPSDAHVVFLFDNGKKQTLDTKEKTVGDLLGKLDLKLIEQDLVEPSLDSPIPEDNFRINIYRARPVTVVDGTNKTVALTAQRSARSVAVTAGLKLHPEDAANFDQGSLSENVIGEKVVISRATPIQINLYGAALTTYTQATIVKDFLLEKQIKLENGETVQPDPKTAITPNMQVFVLKKDAKVVSLVEEIPTPEHVIQDASLSFGTTAVRQAGSPGKKSVTYLIQEDGSGKEISRTLLQEAVIEAAVPKITARGSTVEIGDNKTGLMTSAGIASGDHGYANFIISRESNWGVTAKNPSGAYGLCQALPGSKMSSAGADWESNPLTQLRWCNGYASRYGGWAGAYNFWQSHHYW